MKALNILLYFFILLIFLSVSALNPDKTIDQYVHDQWTSEDGLPQNSVKSIVQTADGYLWFATEEGLVRFDGVSFSLYDTEYDDFLSHNDIMTLSDNGENDVLLGSRAEVVWFKSGRFVSAAKKELDTGLVSDIVKTGIGGYWIATSAKGVFYFDSDEIKHYTEKNGLSGNVVVKGVKTRQNHYCFITDDKNIDCFDGRKFYTKKSFPFAILSLYVDKKGKMWVGTSTKGLVKLNSDDTYELYDESKGNPAKIISGFFEDSSGNFWIATHDAGIMRYKDEVFEVSDKKDIRSLTVSKIFEDREKNLWIGTQAKGLHRLRDGKVTVLVNEEQLDNKIPITLSVRKNGELLIGTMAGGLNKYKNGEVSRYLENFSENHFIYSVIETTDRAIWYSVIGKGVVRLKDGKGKLFTTGYGGEKEMISVLYEDKKERIWMGAFSGGLFLLENGNIINFNDKGLNSDYSVRAITEDRNGKIYIATEQAGYFIYSNGTLENKTKKDGLSSDHLNDISFTSDGMLIVSASNNGITLVRGDKKRALNQEHGLLAQNIFTATEDIFKRDIWLSSNIGLMRLPRKDVTSFMDGKIDFINVELFDNNDGMESGECVGGTQPNVAMDAVGKLYYPTVKGIVMVDPANIHRNKTIPSVKIESVKTDGRQIDLNNENSHINFKAEHSHMEFHYTATTFINPQHVRFKYKLEGLDKKWIDAGNRRVAYYTNLAPGKYTFKVIAANSDGAWNETGDFITFSKQPFIYQTWWFKVIIALFILCVIYAAVYFRFRIIKKRNEELQQLVRERTRELENTHDELVKTTVDLEIANKELLEMSLKDPLTGLRNRRYFNDILKEEAVNFSKRKQVYMSGKNQRSHESDLLYGVYMIDIDYFKQVNDIYGHESGDLVLKQMAEIFKNSVRKSDIVARLGGEEFLIILKGTKKEYIVEFAEKIRVRVEESEFLVLNEKKIHKTCSIGCVIYPFYDHNIEKLNFEQCVNLADLALYRAKNNGRNQSILVVPGDNIPSQRYVLDSLEDAEESGYIKVM